jgi:very-short-patch-repair endonuclease
MGLTIDLELARIAENNHGVFNAEHLRMIGVSEAARTYRLGIGRWSQVHERVYRMAGVPPTWHGDLLAACWAGGTRASASFRSAAVLHELPGQTMQLVEISCPRWRRARHDGVVVHESLMLTDNDTTFVDGIPVTTVERTIFDLCSVCGPRTVDMAIDSALRRRLTTFEDLVSTLRRVGRRGRKGSGRLRELLAERDPLANPTESERERMLIRVLRDHGLPQPIAQHEVRDEHGAFVARVDLAYPEMQIAIEYDSYQEHVGKQQLVRDSRRRNQITALGWTVLVGTAEDVRLGRGHALASAIRRARTQRSTTCVEVPR